MLQTTLDYIRYASESGLSEVCQRPAPAGAAAPSGAAAVAATPDVKLVPDC
jgi:hypothetical protein